MKVLNYLSTFLFKIFRYIDNYNIDIYYKKVKELKYFLNRVKILYYFNFNKNSKIGKYSESFNYFFLNYNVNIWKARKKLKYYFFLKKKIILPILLNIIKLSQMFSINYNRIFFKRFLRSYYQVIKPIKFNYNYNNLIILYNILKQNLIQYCRLKYIVNFKYFNSFIYEVFLEYLNKYIWKYLNFIYFRCINNIKHFYNEKYIYFSFLIKKKIKRKSKRYFLKKFFNLLFFFNNIIKNIINFFFIIWLNWYSKLINCKNIINNIFNNNFFYNDKLFFFSYNWYKKIIWKPLLKIAFIKYKKLNFYILIYKKLYIF